MNYKRYKKELPYAYTFGIYPTIEVLEKNPGVVEKVFFTDKIKELSGYEKIIKLCEINKISYEYNNMFFKTVVEKDNVFAVGVFRKYESLPAENENSVVLINPSDGGNLGTVIRTMTGFDVKNLYIVKPAVDIFHPEVVRASMGALFQIKFKYLGGLEEVRKIFSKSAKNIYCFDKSGVDLHEIEIKKPFVLVFGNEGAGLDKNQFGDGSRVVSIPMSDKIDSYNLAVSVGIALFEFSK